MLWSWENFSTLHSRNEKREKRNLVTTGTIDGKRRSVENRINGMAKWLSGANGAEKLKTTKEKGLPYGVKWLPTPPGMSPSDDAGKLR